jgi:glycosyltransferase involved in cell wall biosynthesis
VSSHQRDLVTVIVPAYNAERTLGRTLSSVRSQTHSELEIIVVDDGSSDSTRDVAEEHARSDSRIHLIAQRNAGVAAARNAGIAQASGDYLAPIDADDLWRADKIERQLRALKAAGEGIGLVYNWSAVIDGDDRISCYGERPHATGDVLFGLCFGNFVGNGSTALMRKSFVVEAGGYDPSLRARRAQGCEDWKLFLALAERSHFAVVYDHLTGYRQAPDAMSGDVLQMLRSDAVVRQDYLRRHPEHGSQVEHGRREYILWMLRRELQAGRWGRLRELLDYLRETIPTSREFGRQVARLAAQAVKRQVRGLRSNQAVGEAYLPKVPLPAGWQMEEAA